MRIDPYADIKKYMIENVDDSVDWRTNEVNSTCLAEDTCEHFQGYVDGDEIPEFYFELANEVGVKWEKEHSNL